MYAIRSRNGKRSFRRSGVEFAADAWTFQDTITDAQRDEPMLLILEVEDETDPRLEDLTPLLKEETEEEDAPDKSGPDAAASLHEAQSRLDALQQAKDQLAGEIVTLQASLAGSEREREGLQSENEGLKAHLAEFAQANQELGQEREAVLAERDSLLAEIEALKAAQTPAAPALSSDGPVGPSSSDAATAEPSGKETVGKEGKSGKNAQAN